MQTIYAKLLAIENDYYGYITYVFQNLNPSDLDYQYIMCVRFPNWQHRSININDEGYLTIRYVQEGVDTWFDGKNNVYYKYTNVIFIKFIELPEKTNEIIID